MQRIMYHAPRPQPITGHASSRNKMAKTKKRGGTHNTKKRPLDVLEEEMEVNTQKSSNEEVSEDGGTCQNVEEPGVEGDGAGEKTTDQATCKTVDGVPGDTRPQAAEADTDETEPLGEQTQQAHETYIEPPGEQTQQGHKAHVDGLETNTTGTGGENENVSASGQEIEVFEGTIC